MKEKKYDELRFTDDFMFCKILLDNKDICKEIIELLLGCKVKEIVYPESQKTIELTSDGKGIRLDVYLEDGKTVYDIEMQTSINREIPKRARYYQGMIDLNLINKGAAYSELKEAYVVFICLDDLFGKGRSIYTFKNVCIEDKEVLLDDDATKVIVNANGHRDNLTKAQIAFLDYVAGKEPSDEFTERLSREVYKARNREEWRVEYMTLLQRDREKFAEGREEGLAEGLAQGIAQGNTTMKNAITNLMKSTNKTFDEACEMLGISDEDKETYR